MTRTIELGDDVKDADRLRSIMTSMNLHIEIDKCVDELFLLDAKNLSYASGKTVSDLLKSWDDHRGYKDIDPTDA